MEKFDINKFKKLEESNEKTFITKDSFFVKLTENIDGFQKDVMGLNSLEKSSKVFYKDSFRLKKEGSFFNNFPIGTHRTYSEKGKIIEEIDYDSPFKFSLEDLQKKILIEFGKNINDSRQRISVSRSTEPYPHYFVIIPLSENPKGSSKVIKINGQTGQQEDESILEYRK